MNRNKKILFVDDEPNILSGLKRMLRPLYKEWTTAFADGAVAGLVVLDQDRYDAVLSDMRMPGMSGAVFLDPKPIIPK